MTRNESERIRSTPTKRTKIVHDPPVRLVMAAMSLGVIVGALYAPDDEAFGSGAAVPVVAAPDASGPEAMMPETAIARVSEDARLD